MAPLGWILAVLGTLAVLIALVMPLAPPGSEVINFQLVTRKIVFVVAGSGFGVGGCVLIVGASIRARLYELAGEVRILRPSL